MFKLQLPLTTRPKPANSHALCLGTTDIILTHQGQYIFFTCISDSHILTILFLNTWSIKKFNSISLKYSKKACNVDCVSQVYHNTLKLLLSDCILIVGTRHELHIGNVERKLEHLRKNLEQRPDVFGKLSEIFRLFLETWQSYRNPSHLSQKKLAGTYQPMARDEWVDTLFWADTENNASHTLLCIYGFL